MPPGEGFLLCFRMNSKDIQTVQDPDKAYNLYVLSNRMTHYSLDRGGGYGQASKAAKVILKVNAQDANFEHLQDLGATRRP